MNEQQNTLQRIGGILSDIADICGLGQRVINESSRVLSSDGKAQFKREITERAETIHQRLEKDVDQTG